MRFSVETQFYSTIPRVAEVTFREVNKIGGVYYGKILASFSLQIQTPEFLIPKNSDFCAFSHSHSRDKDIFRDI